MRKTDLNQLANLFFENLDRMEFDQIEKYVLDVLQQHGFYETACISVSDGGEIGVPTGNIRRTGFYSPDLQTVAVIELSQDWDDYYNYESDTIEWRDYYHLRIYLYNHNKAFTNDDLYFLGDFQNLLVFSYNRNNFNDLYCVE